jgi:hypothetical protein
MGEGRAEAIARGRKESPIKAERHGNALLDRHAQSLTGDYLHHPCEQVVTVIAVRPPRTGRCHWRLVCSGREQEVQRTITCVDPCQDFWDVQPIPKAAGVIEKLANRDLIPVRNTRHPFGDGVSEGDLALPDQLKDEVADKNVWLLSGFGVVISWEGVAAIGGIWSDDWRGDPAWARRLSAWPYPS